MNQLLDDGEAWMVRGLDRLASEAVVPTITASDVRTRSHRRRARQRSGLIAAVAAVGMALAGLQQLAPDRFGAEPATVSLEHEVVPGFSVATTGRSAQVGPMLVLEAALGPEPQFDASALGSEASLRGVVPNDFVVPTDKGGTGDGAALGSDILVSVGEVPGAQIGLHRSRGGDICVYYGNYTTVTGGGDCLPWAGRPLVITGRGQVDPLIGDFSVVVGVPARTSVVVLGLDDGSVLWQRPRGGTAFFLRPGGSRAISIAYLDASGAEL